MWRKKRMYLDIAAGISGNPSSPHEEGRVAKEILEKARTKIARLTEVQSDDVLFTSGATESNALAILGSVRAQIKKGMQKPHVLYLPSAHISIVENALALREEGVLVEQLPIKNYRVDTDALVKMLRQETVLIAMEAVCGETGIIWNTREVATTLQRAGGHALLHVDASQAPLTEKITRAHFGADVLTFDASKIAPVRGIGVLIAHRTIPLEPLYRGGGQERKIRSGSQPPELAHAFAESLEEAVQNREAFSSAASRMRTALVDALAKKIPGLLINESKHQVPNIINISLPGRDTDYVVMLLNEEGVAVSTRSACETDSESGSRAVFALTGDEARALSTLRISWGKDTRPRELLAFVDTLQRAVTFIDSSGTR